MQSTRSTTRAAAYGGVECTSDIKSDTCNTHVCPVHCEMSDWGPYSVCSKTCGIGFKTRERVVETQPAGTGTACPELTMSTPCYESEVCAFECETTGWSAWQPCSVSCGGKGTQQRTRVVTSHSESGYVCPATKEVKGCESEPCSNIPHPCDDGSHGCDQGSGGVCYKSASDAQDYTCGCLSGYFWRLSTDSFGDATHSCVPITRTPTSLPSSAPTNPPTAHPCDDGSHGCDRGPGGMCYKSTGRTYHGLTMPHSMGYVCGCKTGFSWQIEVDDAGTASHTCLRLTATDAPTLSPSSPPDTSPLHPCDDGSHSCDRGPGGACYKSANARGFLCGCQSGYEWQLEVDDSGFASHSCVPPGTVTPTDAPTAMPSATPTDSPTLAPTPHPCDDGAHGCDDGPGGVCYKSATPKGYICGCGSGYLWQLAVDDVGFASHTCVATLPPTPEPTRAPTPHPCEDGSHTCDVGPGGICYQASAAIGYTCGCRSGYTYQLKLDDSGQGEHSCKRVVSTPPPTPHPCDDGSHGCDKGPNGMCYRSTEYTKGYTCGCKSGFEWQLETSDSGEETQSCVAHTDAPTLSPTVAPTGHVCDDGTHDCDKSPGGICYKLGNETLHEGKPYRCGCLNGYLWQLETDDTGVSTHSCILAPSPTLPPTPGPTTWSTILQAHSARLSVAELESAHYHSRPSDHYDEHHDHHTIYYIDFKGADDESASWSFFARDDGRYTVAFEYSAVGTMAAFTSRTEHMEIDHSYIEAFDLDTTNSWTDWQRKEVTMDFHQGVNTLRVEPHTDSEFHLRAVHVTFVKVLRHCTPGEKIPINWFASATTVQNMLSTDAGVNQGQGLIALLEGGVDLEAFGPWLLKFDVHRSDAPVTDNLNLTINNKPVQHLNLHEEDKVYFSDPGGVLHYSMAFESQGTNSANRIQVTNGFAECKGCSHTHCELNVHAGTGYQRVSVHHHNRETQGDNHKCKWDGSKGECQCACQNGSFHPTSSIRFDHFHAE